MAAGSHPFPFRTRKLSPPAPMVLGTRVPWESRSPPISHSRSPADPAGLLVVFGPPTATVADPMPPPPRRRPPAARRGASGRPTSQPKGQAKGQPRARPPGRGQAGRPEGHAEPRSASPAAPARSGGPTRSGRPPVGRPQGPAAQRGAATIATTGARTATTGATSATASGGDRPGAAAAPGAAPCRRRRAGAPPGVASPGAPPAPGGTARPLEPGSGRLADAGAVAEPSAALRRSRRRTRAEGEVLEVRVELVESGDVRRHGPPRRCAAGSGADAGREAQRRATARASRRPRSPRSSRPTSAAPTAPKLGHPPRRRRPGLRGRALPRRPPHPRPLVEAGAGLGRGAGAARPDPLPAGQVGGGGQGARGVPRAHRLDRAAPGPGRLLPGPGALRRRSRTLWHELREASPSAELVAEGRIVFAGSLADRGELRRRHRRDRAGGPPHQGGAPARTTCACCTCSATSTSGPATSPGPGGVRPGARRRRRTSATPPPGAAPSEPGGRAARPAPPGHRCGFRQHGVGVELEVPEGVFSAADRRCRAPGSCCAGWRRTAYRERRGRCSTSAAATARWACGWRRPTRRRTVLAVDRDARALVAAGARRRRATASAAGSEARGSLGYDDVLAGGRFDLVVSNIPAKVGPARARAPAPRRRSAPRAGTGWSPSWSSTGSCAEVDELPGRRRPSSCSTDARRRATPPTSTGSTAGRAPASRAPASSVASTGGAGRRSRFGDLGGRPTSPDSLPEFDSRRPR